MVCYIFFYTVDAQFITAEANTDINTLCTYERTVCMAYLLLIAYNIRVQNSIPTLMHLFKQICNKLTHSSLHTVFIHV